MTAADSTKYVSPNPVCFYCSQNKIHLLADVLTYHYASYWWLHHCCRSLEDETRCDDRNSDTKCRWDQAKHSTLSPDAGCHLCEYVD